MSGVPATEINYRSITCSVSSNTIRLHCGVKTAPFKDFLNNYVKTTLSSSVVYYTAGF